MGVSKIKSPGFDPFDGGETAEGSKNLLMTKKKTSKPAYLQSLSQSEKAENFKILDNMNKKIAYLKNPRFKVSKAPIIMTKVSKVDFIFLGEQRRSGGENSHETD